MSANREIDPQQPGDNLVSGTVQAVEAILTESLPANKLFPVIVSVRDLLDFISYSSRIHWGANFVRAIQEVKPLGPAEFFVRLIEAESGIDRRNLVGGDTEPPELLDREDRATLLSRRLSGVLKPTVKPIIQARILESCARLPDIDLEVVKADMEEFSKTEEFYKVGFLLMNNDDYEQPVTIHINSLELELLNAILIPHVNENEEKNPKKVTQLMRLNRGFTEAGGPTSSAFTKFSLGHT